MARPTTARVVTPKDRAAKREEVAGDGIAVTIAGRKYQVTAGEVCAADVSALRKATGYSFAGLIREATGDPDIDVFAAIAWLARRADGERTLSFEEVARDITYDDITEEVEESPAGDEEVAEGASPEA